MGNPFELLEERLTKIESLLGTVLDSLQSEEKEINFTVEEAAEYLRVSEQSIYKYIKEGDIPATRPGRKYLIAKSDLENSLDEVKSLKYKRRA